MVTVRIGTTTRTWGVDATPSWINQQVERRLEEGVPVCVEVSISTGNERVSLATPACHRGGRSPTDEFKSRALDLWKKHHLDSNDWRGGELVAFLNQADRLD